MPGDALAANTMLEEYRAYLETLTYIQIDPRLRSELSLSDVIQGTMVEAWHDLERIEALDDEGRKHRLRRMLINNLKDMIDRATAKIRDLRRNESLQAALEESSCRLDNCLAIEDTSPSEQLMREEERLHLLEAQSKLDPRQREALIIQKYHGWKLAQIAEHLKCTTGVVAGLQARGLKKLREILINLGWSDA